jgi:riboflavin kinase/FMN adenylyltransferase
VDRWTSLDDVPSGHGPSVVAIGNFDGVHRGHRSVLVRLIDEARARAARAVAITFDPHPLALLHPERAPELITGTGTKLDLLAATGLDATLVMPFTRELAAMTPREFVEQVLVGRLGASAVVVGHDIRFGVRNSGDLSTMQELGAELGFDVVVLDDVTGPVHGEPPGGRRWSSSWVRELLAEGDVASAADVLGRPHRVVGEVVHGDHRGRELGYPTANLSPQATGAVPRDGVYAGWLVRLDLDDEVPDRVLPAAVSIGTNPTFEGTVRRVEAYVLDRTDLDLYGETVAVELVERLRDTVTFTGIEPLVEQMGRDVERCRQVLSVVSPG